MDLDDPAPITTQAELEELWRTLVGRPDSSHPSLWFLLIGADRRPLPQLAQVDDLPTRPDEGLEQLVTVLRGVLDDQEPGGSWAFLRSRPGPARVTDVDRAWARALAEACRAGGVALEVTHLATDDDVVPLPLDAVLAG